MKTSFFSIIAAAALFTSSAAFAAEGPFDRRNDDRNSKDFNYGYDRSHRVTPAERARWEAAHRNNDRRNDRDDHFDRNQNYGYDRNHRVTPSERARWEIQQRETQQRAQREAQIRAAQQREAQQRAQREAARRNHR